MTPPLSSELNENLKKVVKQCKSSFYALATFSFVINLLMLLPSLYMLQVYDRVLSTQNYNTLWMLSLIVFLLLSVMGALEWIRNKILVRISCQIDHLLRGKIYSACFRQALLSGDAVKCTRALKGLGEIRQFIGRNTVFAFFDAPWTPLYIAIMFLFHPLIGWVALGGAIFILSMTLIQEKLTQKTLLHSHQMANQAEATCTSQYQNAEVIEAMGMQQQMQDRWELQHLNMLLSQNQASYLISILSALSKSFRIILQSVILGVGAYLAISQEITPGMMIAGSILLGRALSPVDQLVSAWRGFITARVQFRQLNALLNISSHSSKRFTLPALQGDVRVEHLVVHSPDNKTAVAKNISFGLRPGDSMAIIGASGSGKSSLVRAILGIWPHSSGTIRLDNAELKTWDREQLGPYIGYLPQDVELFDGTIAENIARFGQVDDEQVIKAAQTAAVHDMILQLPDGYNTRIGVNGRGLSGGQRQRIGLARAVYRMPKVIILDEPNSNLDERGEHALSLALRRIKEMGSTFIIVSHRTNVLSQVDKVMLMHEGIMKLYGERDQVLARLNASNAPIPISSSSKAS